MLQPNRCWHAHSDAVTTLVPLGEHGCVMTLSLDGFHRCPYLGPYLGPYPGPDPGPYLGPYQART